MLWFIINVRTLLWQLGVNSWVPALWHFSHCGSVGMYLFKCFGCFVRNPAMPAFSAEIQCFEMFPALV